MKIGKVALPISIRFGEINKTFYSLIANTLGVLKMPYRRLR
jgi:hypothetical protein